MSNTLRRILAQEDTIIFIGSGISRWSGLPSWEGVISELAEFLDDNGSDAALVRQEAANGDLLQAASYGFQKLTPPQVAEFIRQTCRIGRSAPHAIHRAIMALGPTCFITTNYDDLLEQAYLKHHPTKYRPRVVLNVQLIEQAEIIHAQARDFIFKPHGDAGHAESIVLTREQYRMLMPEGKFSATLNTFKTLLQSRPVLFLGFGLRDPDFLHLRDLLANIYRGGMRDHYAIVADPVHDHVEYWRAQYGIHLIGYATADNGRDHSELLSLLENLSISKPQTIQKARFEFSDPAAVLALARYAAGCLTPGIASRFDIVARLDGNNGEFGARSGLFRNWQVDRLFEEGPRKLILLGEPGAGKSFAVQDAVNLAASRLQDTCLRGELHAGVRIPIAIDLKLYDGDLVSLIAGKFPQGLSLDQLYAEFPISLYLDGYNEMPRAFRENGSFDHQLEALVGAKPDLGIVICSRTTDGLESLDLPVFRLSEVHVDEVNRRILAGGVNLPALHRDEIIRILQRPFYFRLLAKSVMMPDQISSPGDLYSQYIKNVATSALAALGQIDLITALQRHAYATLERGSEAFAIKDLEGAIIEASPALNATEIERVTNWLASEEVIIPMRGERAAFVHQSVTEYLAACELKARLESGADNVEKLIALRRWDDAIFLALSMLDESIAADLLTEITERDITFALKAARYVQHGCETLIGQLLSVIAELPSNAFDFGAKFAFSELPFAPSHESALRRILFVPVLRGDAFKGLAKCLGPSIKQELIACLFAEDGEGSIREIGQALNYVLQPNDLAGLVERLIRADAECLHEDGSVTSQQVSAVAAAAKSFSLEELRRETADRLDTFSQEGQRIIAALIGEICFNRKSSDALKLLITLSRAKLLPSTFSLYMMIRYEPNLFREFIDSIDDELFAAILSYVYAGDNWSVELLRACAAEDGILKRVTLEGEAESGVRRALLNYIITANPTPLLENLETWSKDRSQEHSKIFDAIDYSQVDWSSHHDLLVSLLALHDLELARLVLGGSFPTDLKGLDNLDLGEPEPWVDWLLQLIDAQTGPDERDAQWVAMQLGHIIANSNFVDNKARIFELLDQGTPSQRWAIGSIVLPNMEGLSMADFSQSQIEFLKSLITAGQGGHDFRPHVFSQLADETFLRTELVPLCTLSKKAHSAVDVITRAAGKRLGIRIELPISHRGWQS